MKASIKKQKNKGGRPEIVLTGEQKKKVRDLACICTTQQIADYLGISRRGFFNLIERDEGINALYKKGRIQAKKIMGSRLFKKGVIEGDTTAMIFYMKTQGGWKAPAEEREEEAVKIETPEEKKELRMYLEWKKEREEARS